MKKFGQSNVAVVASSQPLSNGLWMTKEKCVWPHKHTWCLMRRGATTSGITFASSVLSRYLIFFQFKHGSHDSFLVFFQNLDQRISKQSNELVLREGTCWWSQCLSPPPLWCTYYLGCWAVIIHRISSSNCSAEQYTKSYKHHYSCLVSSNWHFQEPHIQKHPSLEL